MALLSSREVNCTENRLRMGRNYMVTDYIIVHPDGKPVCPEYLSQMFKKLQEMAGLAKCRFHDLRHLWTSSISSGRFFRTLRYLF